ncbi:MAG: hypothetical protein AB1757_02085 [Acidobacteriota bacterium]
MIYLRGIVIWLLIIFAETLHGTARTLLLEPVVGDFRARQITVFTGIAIIFLITYAFIRWLRATTVRQLLSVGWLWVGLTVSFEIFLGRVVFKFSWERILSDYHPAKGGLLAIGMLAMALSPLIAAKLRRLI